MARDEIDPTAGDQQLPDAAEKATTEGTARDATSARNPTASTPPPSPRAPKRWRAARSAASGRGARGTDRSSRAPQGPMLPGSTAPADGADPGRRATLPRLGARGVLLFLWRQLTSMQTALVLLMLLAVAAVPGSLYPQRSVDPGLTDQFLAENGTYGKVLDTLGFFDVFSSPWFSAIYLLLFVSLVGCIVPRLGVLIRQLRSRPPRTPRRLDRFVGHSRTELPGRSDEELIAQASAALKRRRYRLDVHTERHGASISAERGYLREAGNLLFHIALVGVLAGVALGHLTQYRGQVTVIEGEGFSNTLAGYDSFTPGPWFDASTLPEFQFTLDDFRAEYDTSPTEHEFGQPRKFEADVSVTDPGTGTTKQTVRVNQPMHVPGASVYLLGNGYAPDITITDPTGQVVAQGPFISIPRDSMYTSQLVLKAPDARPEQIAVVGIFMPTAEIDETGPHSRFPDLVDPQIAMSVYTGDLGLDQGVPQNAYQIDVSTLTPVTDADGQQVLLRMAPGQSQTLPDGTTIAFNGVKRYAAFDIKHDPFAYFTLGAALAATSGLALSLFVPRRRVWVRVTRRDGEDGPVSVLEVAGLARSEDHRLQAAVEELAARLAADAGPDAPEGAAPGGKSRG